MRVLLVALLCALSYAQTETWSTVGALVSSHSIVVNSVGPSSNTPTANVDGTIINFDVCNVADCQDNHPVVTVELTLSMPITAVRGSFLQQSTGSNGADDCLTRSASDTWYPTVTGHDGYVMFGTPQQVLYGGCAYGGNFGTETTAVTETTVPETTVLRFVGTQSVNEESFLVDFANIEVLATTSFGGVEASYDSGWFTMSSQNGDESFQELAHNLGVYPDRVLVQVQVPDGYGNNVDGFCFEGMGFAQTDDDQGEYGGLIFGYDDNNIRLWAPTVLNGVSSGRILFVTDGWGDHSTPVNTNDALVRVQAWTNYYPPADYTSDWFEISAAQGSASYNSVTHGLGAYPDLVKVEVRATSTEHSGYVFEGMGSAQTDDEANEYGGLIFAYSDTEVRMWVPDDNNANAAGHIIMLQDGWGNQQTPSKVDTAQVRVLAWLNPFRPADYDSGWVNIAAQSGSQSQLDLNHNLGELPGMVRVQTKGDRVGGNGGENFYWDAMGAAQTDDDQDHYGGLVFGYDTSTVRLWAPNANNGVTHGTLINVRDGWGGEVNSYYSESGQVRVRAWLGHPMKDLESCTGLNSVDFVPSGISGAQSSLNSNSIDVVVEFPGYMYYHSLEMSDSTFTPTFDVEYPADCADVGHVTGSFSLDELLQNSTIQADAVIFSLDFSGEFFYSDDISGERRGVPVTKNIPFTVGLPTSTILNVTFGLESSSPLLFGIDAYAMGYANDGNRHFGITFHTFVLDGWQFSGDWSEDSTYFISEQTSVTLVSTEAHDQADFGPGFLQTWTVDLYAPNVCGERVEEVNLELFNDRSTQPELVRFQLQLSDTDDCVVELGSLAITSSILVSDGNAVYSVDESIPSDIYLDGTLEFMVSFDSKVAPLRTSLASLDVSQQGASVCPSCQDNAALQFTCFTCTTSEFTSDGAAFNFSISLAREIFTTHPDHATPTSLAMEFYFEYSRRHLTAVDKIQFPLSFNLRDWDCHLPNALVGVAQTFACLTPQTTYIKQCNTDGTWRNMTTCLEETSMLAYVNRVSPSSLLLTMVALFMILSCAVFGALSRRSGLNKATGLHVDTMDSSSAGRTASVVSIEGGSMYVERFD